MSSKARHAQVRELFLAALGMPADACARFLEESCRADSTLRIEVEHLLAMDAQENGKLRSHASSPGALLRRADVVERALADLASAPARDTVDPELPGHPKRIGRYDILGILGRGGMGIVYLAEQENPKRAVALKVIRSGVATPSVLRRFEHEAEVLARMHHPCIAQIHEADTFDTGDGPQPFFAMELVEGEPLTEYAVAHNLGIRERLALLVNLCRAVQHAHERGVIHRDLKPGNVLVDAEGRPKVLDFGVARVTDALRQVTIDRTAAGAFVGTLPYMCPEQIRGEIDAVDPRTDVYALGVITYELLVGRLPHEIADESLPEAARIVCDETPLRLGEIDRRLRGDIETIVAKALEKDREMRYSSAAELATDIERFLGDRPIVAQPPSTAYQLRKFARRNRAVVGAALSVLFVLVAGVIVSTILYVQEKRILERLGRFSDLKSYEKLEAQLDRLWPAVPGHVPDYETWLATADKLRTRASIQLSDLAESSSNTQLGEPDARVGDASGDNVDDPTWLIPGLAAEFQKRLTQFFDPIDGLRDGISADHGLGIARRLEFARTVAARSIEGADVRARWDEAIASIADPVQSPAYHGLRIPPQLGLVPIGADPRSGLWEFADLQTGEIPCRDPSMEMLDVTERTGLVFVLLPGGLFSLGAQSTDPLGINYDLHVPSDLTPREVTLEPFFISKYEMTQGQWLAVTGRNPSLNHSGLRWGEHLTTAVHPVENVSWDDCSRVLLRLNLELPSVEQWEYAARAGSTTAWWTGSNRESIDGSMNLADVSYASVPISGQAKYEGWLVDGYAGHAPVNAFRPNPFGLHNVTGNVFEWCLDEVGDNIDGNSSKGYHFVLGGSFLNLAEGVGISAKGRQKASTAQGIFGVRPVRALGK